MKSKQNNIWAKLSSSQKLNLIGSGLMIISLFLNWFSDTDIFRSGDTYSGLSGPLYLVGFSLMAMALTNVLVTFTISMNWAITKNIGESRMGKLQMIAGFSSMYLLLVVNSVYFSPQFGLNILNKRSEIGVMLALVSTVMICIGGYLAYRKRFEGMEAVEEIVQVPVEEKLAAAVENSVPNRPHATVAVTNEIMAKAPSPAISQSTASATAAQTEESKDIYFSDRDPRGKTDYERNKLYENLRKTMLRDTMSPQQRKKERAKDTQSNAFSANFGKGAKSTKVAATKAVSDAGELSKKSDTESSVKKPQMYRMDL